MADSFYQISIIISGKLLDFMVEDSNYNKYKTGTGTLLVTDGPNTVMFPVTAGSDLFDQLKSCIGQYVEIKGAVRNYRRNEEKYNIVRVYSIAPTEENTNINSVQATCEVVGVMTKPGLTTGGNVKAAQLYLLTNEKYDKHTRLNAVLFGTATSPITLDALPSLGKIYNFEGYLQLDKANQHTIVIDEQPVQEGKLELVITNFKEV